MIIGIMSDSHGDLRGIERAASAMGKADVWLHAGDFCGDADHLAACAGTPVISVAGNCDGLAARSPEDEFVELAGKKIWLTHGHQCGVKSGTGQLVAKAKAHGVDLVVYGHTHISEIRKAGDLFIINPGSVSRPRFAPATFAKVTIESGAVLAELIDLR